MAGQTHGRGQGPDEHGDEREFDLRWADAAEHKEPSARARMLAARWKDSPPEAVPFRGDPDGVGRQRSGWGAVALVLGCVVAVILVLGYLGFQPPYW
ncbi:hypothetical protein [Streptomyces sp. bgisy154]|uniref:SCO2583/SCO2584 N-terminal domain-containing protein n=1 Tax=Streptomyces sp. bgisy154 TaxID=3413794 RepID=UPI003D72B91F